MVDMIEGHPIPQDITGFQFRLIGDMTVKQFAYVIVGLIFGWLIFSLPIFILIKLPIAGISVLSGVIFAFVPIQGVPADTLFLLFFKALFSPNQYVYQKQGDLTPTAQTGTPISLETAQIVGMTPTKSTQTPPLASNAKSNTTAAPQVPSQSPHIVSPSKSEVIFKETKKKLPSQPMTQQTPPPITQTQPVVPTLQASSQPTLTQLPTAEPKTSQIPPSNPNPFEKQLQDILKQKEQLEQQLKQLTQQNQPAATQAAPQNPSAVGIPPPPVNQQDNPYKKVADQPKKKVAIASFMPDVPNLIAGIIKDPRGNVLPNILVEVKDKDDNPVRAFKTNALGQFASATQLLNGTYTILFEDPKKQQRFDTIELTANGAILPPLEIISIDEREDLRKSLFST